MKRLLLIAVSTALLLSLGACASPSIDSSIPPSSTPDNVSSVNNSNANNDRVGLGFVSTTSESSDATTETTGNAKFNVSACAVSVDANGKILDVKFDTLKASIGFDVSGALTGDVTAELKTKKELGDSYGMKQVSGIGKEWYEQIAALEEWMRGKTVSDVLNMKVTERDEAHKDIPDEEDLKTSVTISVTDQLRALEKAYANAK